jgi:hypothetical protein
VVKAVGALALLMRFRARVDYLGTCSIVYSAESLCFRQVSVQSRSRNRKRIASGAYEKKYERMTGCASRRRTARRLEGVGTEPRLVRSAILEIRKFPELRRVVRDRAPARLFAEGAPFQPSVC